MNITYAYIETTTYCNLECKFCNRTEVISGLHHMPLGKLEIILSQLKKYPITEIKLHGMGEPFMHPQFNTVVRRFRETFPNAFIISSTNCQFTLTPAMQDTFKYLDMCYLSIDGAKENYEDIRVGASWDKLLSFLSSIQSYLPEVPTCQFPINFTICPQNVYDIDAMLSLKEQYGLSDLRLNIVQNWNEEDSITELNGFTSEQLLHITKFKQYLKGKAPWEYSDCFWIKNGCYITATGEVKMCCINTSAQSIGNIFRQPIELIHSSKKFIEIKDGCESNCPSTHCEKCSYRELSPFLGKIYEL